MKRPVRITYNGDFREYEIAGGRDATEWLDVVQYDDGSKQSFVKGDPALRDMLADPTNQIEINPRQELVK